jgi:hypothetical protein
MTTDRALDLALEALELTWDSGMPHPNIMQVGKAITAIKQARALDKKADNARELGLDYEPVPENFIDALKFDVAMRDAAPVQEPVACKTLCELCVKRGYAFCANAAKTTPITVPPAKLAQHEPEHIVHSNGRYSPLLTHMMNKRVGSNVKQVIHLYDELPAAQRQWTGLTDEEIDHTEWIPKRGSHITYDIGWLDNMKIFARAIEAKLKEKNT